MNKLFKTVTDSIADRLDQTVVQLKQVENVSHQILIEALSVEMSIGILPEEKQAKQIVVIDLIIDLVPKHSYEDSIDETVSYADVADKIQTLAALKHYNLVETFATDIARMCFEYTSICRIEASVKKPNIMSEAKNVGFKLIQKRSS